MRYLAAMVLPILAAAGFAAPAGGPWSLTFRLENDLPFNSDRYYTNGAGVAFARCLSPQEALWPALLGLPGLNRPGLLAQSYDLGQIMVTPADISRPDPDPADRPYAGLLYLGISWQRLDEDHYAALKLISGVVGPASLAEQTQKLVHRITGSPQPRGWDRQLRGEPILNLVYERRRRAFTWGDPGGWGGDALLTGGVMLGNVLTQGYAQFQLRGGWHTPRDFGTTLIRGLGNLPPARDHARGVHFHAGAGLMAVAHNLTLDGGGFRSGPAVARRPWVPTLDLGAVVRGRRWQLAASWITWTREFDSQPKPAEFATLALTLFR